MPVLLNMALGRNGEKGEDEIMSFEIYHILGSLAVCQEHACSTLLDASQTVPPTSIASLDPTLPALEDVMGKLEVTLLALVGAQNILPLSMDAIVSLSKHFCSLLNSLDSDWIILSHAWDIALHYQIGSG